MTCQFLFSRCWDIGLGTWRILYRINSICGKFWFTTFFLRKRLPNHSVFYEMFMEIMQRWFRRFKSGDFEVSDKDRPGQPKKFDDRELEALLDEDPCQTQSQLAESLGVGRQTIGDRLKAMGKKTAVLIHKKTKWTQNWENPFNLFLFSIINHQIHNFHLFGYSAFGQKYKEKCKKK